MQRAPDELRGIAAALSLVVLAAAPAPAAAENVWTDSFLLQGSGFENPLVRVGFNPCPEPPGRDDISLTDPSAPAIQIPTVLGEGGPHSIVFGISLANDVRIQQSGAPDADGNFTFGVLDSLSGQLILDVALNIADDGGAQVVNWSSMAVPSSGPGFTDVGFAFDFAGVSPLAPSNATLTMQVMDPGGGANLSFELAPANTPALVPLAIALLGALLGVLAWRKLSARRRGRRGT